MKSKFNTTCHILPFIIGICLLGSANAQSDSIIFNFKPKAQSWMVPKGVTSIHVDAYGAQGGSAKGGKGGRVQCDLSVEPEKSILIFVGSQPDSSEGGYNGGGAGCGNGTGGGGASDIRIGGDSLPARVLVAGGGGGMGYYGISGAGGGLEGGAGSYDTLPEHIAKGGTQTEGGAAGRAYLSNPGEAGVGGKGLDNNGVCSNNAMGGGGGGYFGGGASAAGGAGGGSSYTNSSCSKVIHEQGAKTGHGKIVIYWTKRK